MTSGVTGSDPGHGTDEQPDTSAEREEGRPTGAPPATPGDTGRPDAVRETTSGTSTEAEPTIAPEEKGDDPETEHAPGADL